MEGVVRFPLPETRKAGGTHPTGLLSCLNLNSTEWSFVQNFEFYLLVHPVYYLEIYFYCESENIKEQECIPVGCVLAARRPYSGVPGPGGLPAMGGWSAWSGGVCLVWGGGCSSLRGEVVCLVWGGSSLWGGGLPGPGVGSSLLGGVCLVRGVPPCRGGLPGPETPPLTESQTRVKT